MPAKSTFGSASVIPYSSSSSSYKISRSLRFNSADAAYLTYTPAVDGDRYTWTWSGWIKRTNIGSAINYILYGTGAAATGFVFTANDNLYFYNLAGIVYPVTLLTNQVFRDTSSWYHIVLVYDANNATASNRQRIYVNGQRITSFSTEAYTTDPAYGINRASYPMTLGVNGGYFDGYMAEVNFIDGQALTPSSFGYTDSITGSWMPKKYVGTYGTNGSYLKFADNSSTASLGTDSSGKNNTWTANNFSVTAGAGNDSLVDSPTDYGLSDTGVGGEISGNYATLNSIDAGGATLSNGNLDISSTANQTRYSTIPLPQTGKWYFEFTVNSLAATNTGFWIVTNQGGVFGLPVSGAYRILKGASDISISGSGTPAAGHVMKVAYDATNGKIWLGRDTLWFSNAGNTTSDPSAGTNPSFSSLTPTSDDFIYILQTGGGGGACTGSINFGQRPFAYTAPTGFKTLCTTNLPTPTIKKSSTGFDAVTYTGNATGQTISSLGFSPNLVWLKSRTNATYNYLFDTVRGINTFLFSNTTTADTTTKSLISFDSNGFSLGADPAPDTSTGFNASGSNQIAWCWNRSIIAGLDIVGYVGNDNSGRTISHNLGVTPKMIIVKNRTTVSDWPVYHANLTASNVVFLQLTNAQNAISTYAWGAVSSASSTTFTVIAGNTDIRNVNKSGDNYVAYCFSEVEGFSKFGSYTGNGLADGPFVFCGFKPKYVMVKKISASGPWMVFDSSRDVFNVASSELRPNENSAEPISGKGSLDFLSNGFKIRSTSTTYLGELGDFIFVAFAESPFKYARAR